MNLTYKQNIFVDSAMTGHNIFLTGKAGTGKSTIVKQVIELLTKEGKKVIACAPTGIAANNIEGQTIHSLFSLNPFGVLDFDGCNFVNSSKRDVLRTFDVLVIDEVSMLRPDTLDAIHWTLIKNGLRGLANRQVIFVGDLKQLPVVLDDNTRSVLYQSYRGCDFTFANIYNRIGPIVVELDEIMRQSDPEFIHALNEVRDGRRADYFKQFVGDAFDDGVILAPHNKTVERYNREGLARITGETFLFEAAIEGAAKTSDFSLDHLIEVKEGCKIMYLVNSKNNPLRNGTIGTFVVKEEQIDGYDGDGIEQSSITKQYFIRVGSIDYALEHVEVAKKAYVFDRHLDALKLVEVGKIRQYPFRLAYALSIHKAQGMTFEKVSVDLHTACFMRGQLYVALSRAKTPQGLRIVL